MSDVLRIIAQLQFGGSQIDAVKIDHKSTMPADVAIKAVSDLNNRAKVKAYDKDVKWKIEVAAAVKEMHGLIKKCKSGKGLLPKSNGNLLRVEFKYNKQTYRLDLVGGGNIKMNWLTAK